MLDFAIALISNAEFLTFLGAAFGAAATVLGAIYVEKWKANRAVTEDRHLLIQALISRRVEIKNLQIKGYEHCDFLLTEFKNVAQAEIEKFVQKMNETASFIDDAKSSVFIEEFYVLDTMWKVKFELSNCITCLQRMASEVVDLEPSKESWTIVESNIQIHIEGLVKVMDRAEWRLIAKRQSW